MELHNISKSSFIKRYKRFFCEILLDSTNEVAVAHCPNSGSMLGLLNTPNTVAYVSKATNESRKLRYTLELLEIKNCKIGVNTHNTNKIVYEALQNNKIANLSYDEIIKETKYNNSRFDFALLTNKTITTYIEVKNVTMSRKIGLAEFPDSVTERGKKHLLDLMNAKKQGFRVINLYVIQRSDTKEFTIAKDIDPEYYKTLLEAKQIGVEFLAYDCNISSNNINLASQIPIIDNA